MDYFSIDPLYERLLEGLGFESQAKLSELRILIATDRFDFTDENRRNLSELVNALQSVSPFLKVRLDTGAHHTRTRGGRGAEYPNLDFANLPLEDYDEIWLFGVEESDKKLPTDEVKALKAFMQGGGGVFATGDHEEIGAGFCAELPRVRSMRLWTKPPTDMTCNPISTVTGNEYRDAIPQTIYSRPHPVLTGPFGRISVLPDHEHEGRVVVPCNLDETFELGGKEYRDYPYLPNGKVHLPEIIASSVNQNDGTSFGAIGTFDGHELPDPEKVGRVLVDSTWHHFINENLNQFRYHFERVREALQYGAIPNPKSLPVAIHYSQMRAYFRNTARWLARPTKQLSLRWSILSALRWHASIQMVLRPEIPDSYPLRYLQDLGVKARRALEDTGSIVDFQDVAKQVAESIGLGGLLEPQHGSVSVIDPDLLTSVLVGGAVHSLRSDSSPESTADEAPEDGFRRVSAGVRQALGVFHQHLNTDLRGLSGPPEGASTEG